MTTAPSPSKADIQESSGSDQFEPQEQRVAQESNRSVRRGGYGAASDSQTDRLIEQAYRH